MNIIGTSGLDNSVAFKRRELPGLDPRCYRIAQGFDAAAALVTGDGIVAAAAEERFDRKKMSGAFPARAIRYCLEQGGIGLGEIDAIAQSFEYAPYEEFFRASEFTSRQFDEVYSAAAHLDRLRTNLDLDGWSGRLLHVPHHLAHAASAHHLSGFEESVILVADGMGEAHGLTVAVGRGGDIEILRRVPAVHSLGIFYSVFTYYLGFDFALDEYKVMGLAPYGDPAKYFDRVMTLIELGDNGQYAIPVLGRNESLDAKETYAGTLVLLEEEFGPPRTPGGELTQRHKDIAAAVQSALQATLLHILRHFKNKTGQTNLTMAGGVALNCSANGVIHRSRTFQRMFIQPAAGDDGSALGAALHVRSRLASGASLKPMTVPFWGPEFGPDEILAAVEGAGECRAKTIGSTEELVAETARLLAGGAILGWFQGRMEFGPRALGNRSILADPRASDMRSRVNALIKKREGFRPFAPAVTAEDAATYFKVNPGEESLFATMLFVTHVRREYRDRLPAVTHVDGSARVQTVAEPDNPRFWQLLKEFGRVSGMPVLLNTSFNVKGQPIVCTPAEAVETFVFARLDALVIGDLVVTRVVE